MSASKSKSDREEESEEVRRAESFYSVGSHLPEETMSCVSVLSEYNQEALEKTFSGIDGNDPLSGDGIVLISAPCGDVSEAERKDLIETLTKYRDPAPIHSSESVSEEEQDVFDNDHPDLPETSCSGSDESRPMSPLGVTEEEYTEYVDIPVPEELQKIELRTPLMTFLRDVVGLMVNARDEPLYSLQKYDAKKGDIRLVRKGRLYKCSTREGLTPILECPDVPSTKTSNLGEDLEVMASSSRGPRIFLDGGPIERESANGLFDVIETVRPDNPWDIPSRSTTPGGRPSAIACVETKLPTLERVVSPVFSNHYSQTSSTEEESEEEDEADVEQETYTFICPVLDSDDVSVKKFPGAEVEPLIKAGLAPPAIFRALLNDRGVLRAMEAVLDIAQTHMS